MIRKARKLRRSWRARLRPDSCLPMHWHVGTPNFGDDINPDFYEALSGCRIRLTRDREAPHFLGMGSILETARPGSVVLGSGLLRPDQRPAAGRVVALRGRLSAHAMGLDGEVMLGDPMVLLDRIMQPEGGDAIGLVPHARSLPHMRRQIPAGLRLVDVSLPPWQVIRQIGQCRAILSQSLHGLIVADAFRIPNLWLAPSAAMAGGRFKFDDYFSTLDHVKTPHEITPELLQSPPLGEASVGRYKGDKAAYHARLAASLREGLQG